MTTSLDDLAAALQGVIDKGQPAVVGISRQDALDLIDIKIRDNAREIERSLNKRVDEERESIKDWVSSNFGAMMKKWLPSGGALVLVTSLGGSTFITDRSADKVDEVSAKFEERIRAEETQKNLVVVLRRDIDLLRSEVRAHHNSTGHRGTMESVRGAEQRLLERLHKVETDMAVIMRDHIQTWAPKRSPSGRH